MTSSTVNNTFAEDKTEARIKMVTAKEVKNPLSFTDPIDKQAATLAKIQRVTSNPAWKELGALNPEYQQKYLEHYYNKFVVPAFNQGHFQAPEKDLWIREMQKEPNKFSPAGYYSKSRAGYHAEMIASHLTTGASEIFKGMTHAGIWVGQKEALASLHAHDFFKSPETGKGLFNNEEQINLKAEYARKKVDEIASGIFDSDTLWTQMHQPNTLSEKLDSIAGETLAQLPFWEAIGEVRLAGIGTTGEVSSGAKNLTKALTATKTGQFVAHRLGEATDAYIGGSLTGQSTKDKILSMIGFMGMGSLGAGVANIGSMAVKKLTANTLLMGGRPLQETVTNQAEHELIQLIIGHDSKGQEIKIEPISAMTGKVHVGDNHVEYHSLEQQQQLVHRAIQEVHHVDPVKAKLVTAEKITLGAMAKEKFGKAYRDLSAKQRGELKIARGELVNQAIAEAPLHLPDIAKHINDVQVAQDAQKFPKLGLRIQEFEQKFGVKVSDVVTDAEGKKVATETGLVGAKKNIKEATEIIIKRQKIKNANVNTGVN